MNTCVRCGTQFAAGEDRCPFCSLAVAGDADVTRAAPPSGPGWQQGQQPSGQGPWQQQGQQPSGQGPWQQGQQGPGPWQQQGQQPGQPWQQGGPQGPPQGGGWQGGPPPGGAPWQQGGGMPPKKGLSPGVLIGIGVAVLLVLGLGAWGLVAAFSGDDDSTTADDGDQTSESASPSPSPSESASEEPSPTESTESSPSPTEDQGGGGGGGGADDVVAFDLASGEAVVTVTVSSPGRLRIEAQSDVDEDIVMVVNDPDGEEVCNEDSLITYPEECTLQAVVGEYEVVITPYDEQDSALGTGEVRLR